MSKNGGIHKKLGKVRAPRVHLTYDVEVGGETKSKEIPFVMGVVGEFSGNVPTDTTRLKDKKFVSVDLENFDEVMRSIKPTVAYSVENVLTDQAGKFGVELEFNGINDFSPEAIAQQVDPIRELVEARARLADLRNKISTSEKLEDILDDVLRNTEKVKALSGQTTSGDDHNE